MRTLTIVIPVVAGMLLLHSPLLARGGAFAGGGFGGGSIGGAGGSAAPVAGTGTGGGPPAELQGGRGVYKPRGSGEAADCPSWDSDWWARDPQPDASRAVGAEVGTALDSLPLGYDTAYLSSQPYYYYRGTFYESTETGFEVIAAPIGITVRSEPEGADLITVDGVQYFRDGDAYCQALYSGNGLVYQVVADPTADK